jgi:hypothetical protein
MYGILIAIGIFVGQQNYAFNGVTPPPTNTALYADGTVQHNANGTIRLRTAN